MYNIFYCQCCGHIKRNGLIQMIYRLKTSGASLITVELTNYLQYMEMDNNRK